MTDGLNQKGGKAAMCTAITLQTAQGEALLGRTMDFSHPLEPQLYAVPRGAAPWGNRWAFLGMGQDIGRVVLADGVNEGGLAAAALYFPGYASFPPPSAARAGEVAAVELVNRLLGSCASAAEAAALLEKIRIVGVPDPVTGTVAPLHWILQDRSGRCLTAEQTASGLRLLENPVGVLSNSPDLPWHLTNLRKYAGLSPLPHPDARWEGAELSPFGQGSGGLGLPGDYTPPSRFVRAAFLKSHAPVPASRQEAVVTGFHLLESVTVPRGAVITDRGTQDYTQYTVFYSTVSGECWFKSYHNSQVLAARLSGGLAHGPGIRSLAVLNHPAPFQRVPAE